MRIEAIQFWPDSWYRSAAENMALDEALLRRVEAGSHAIARFYRWDHDAVTLGYSDRDAGDGISIVRRFTGGGRVEHGEDLTFALAFPRGALAELPTTERYRFLHEAIAFSLEKAGCPVSLAEEGVGERGPCFANPVGWDLLDPETGRKIGGGAQRRTRFGLLHQGSLRLPAGLREADAWWIGTFLRRIAEPVETLDSDAIADIESVATDLEHSRYITPAWNQPRSRSGT